MLFVLYIILYVVLQIGAIICLYYIFHYLKEIKEARQEIIRLNGLLEQLRSIQR